MATNTPHGRALAIAASVSFTIGGLTILLGDVILKPAEWTSYHALTVLTVFGTVAAGHLMMDAGRGRNFPAAFGFLVLFLSGTALVVYQSVGRQAETADTVVLSAEATNKALADKGVELAQARQRLKDANDMVDKETKNKRCGQACTDWKTRVTEVTANVTQIETAIAKLGPAKPVAPKAEKMAAVAELFGADKAQAKAALMLAEPFFWTMFFEIGSIVSLGFAFRRIERPSISETRTFSDPAIDWNDLPQPTTFSGELPDPTPPRGPKRRKPLPATNVVPFPAKHPVVAALENNGGAVASNRQLAKLMGVSDGEASKRWQEVQDQLEITREGKQLKIALR